MNGRRIKQPVLSRRTAYRLVAYGVTALFVGTTVPTPLYRAYQQEFHFSAGTLTLIFAAYIGSLLPFLLVLGHLSDAVGRRPVLVAGLTLAAAGAVVFAAAQGIAWLVVARLLQGVATALTMSTATAALADLHPSGDQASAALAATAGNAGGAALGPLMAGLLAQYVPWPLVSPYLAYLLMLAPTVAIVWMPETVARRVREPRWLRWPGIPSGIRGAFALASGTSFVSWGAAALFLTLVPSYVAQLLRLDSLAVGGAVVFLMLGASTLVQITLRNLPVRIATTAGLIILPVGLGGIVAAVPLGSAVLLLAATPLVGAGQGMAFMGSLAEVNRIAPEERRAEVASAFYVVTYVGVATTAVGVGFATQAVGLFMAVLLFAIVVAVLALALAALQARR